MDMDNPILTLYKREDQGEHTIYSMCLNITKVALNVEFETSGLGKGSGRSCGIRIPMRG